ncbi:MAG: hypothetical protein M3R17_00045 [Bacteroidota bacterium]|nr:hypothetical protein [Bacteroidota bacterium]
MLTSARNTEEKSIFDEEVENICSHYGLTFHRLERIISPLKSSFEKYWEMVFASTNFELITAGEGNVFAQRILDVASLAGLSQKTLWLFFHCHLAFPSAITGIKVCFSKDENLSPTLYVRVKADVKEAIVFLRKHLGEDEITMLQSALSNNKILYGLGFSEKNGLPYLKTYTIGEVDTPGGEKINGFISHRLSGQELSKEHKTYLPEISLENFQTDFPELKRLVNFLVSEMNYTRAGHIGMLHNENNTPEYKIYVERKGGIPTDFSAR